MAQSWSEGCSGGNASGLATASEDELLRNVKMIHFNGKWVEPWWSLNTFCHEAVALARKQLEHSDPHGMMALAVAEWLPAVESWRRAKFSIKSSQTICTTTSIISATRLSSRGRTLPQLRSQK